MPNVHGPYLDHATIEEVNGCVERLVCQYIVDDCTDGLASPGSIEKVIKAAYNALDVAGIVPGLTSTDFPELMISERNLSMENGQRDRWACEVTLLNIGRLEGIGIFSTSCSEISTTTSTDYRGLPITVEYTYPDPFPPCPQVAGQTIVQGVSLNVMLPVRELTATKLVSTPNIDTFELRWISRLNESMWRGNPRGTVRCINVSHKFARMKKGGEAGNRYLVQFTFQWLGQGQQPWARFNDPYTGAPPPDLIRGVGYYQMNGIEKLGCFWYPYYDFSSLFPGA